MSRPSSSLELSEFFNDDDSEGHRFVEFIQKRRGNFNRQNFLFLNHEPQRLSLNVELEKAPGSNDEVFCEANINCRGTSETSNNNNNDSHKSLNARSITKNKEVQVPGDPVSPNLLTTAAESLTLIENIPLHNEVQPDIFELPISKNVSPNSFKVASASKATSIMNPSFLRPISPRISSIRKSGGVVSANDKLRRYSLKRRFSKLTSGRRILLQEFESTIEDPHFKPSVCSTPISQPPDLHSRSNMNASKAETGSSEKNLTTNKSCSSLSDDLTRAQQRKNDKSKVYIENIDNTIEKNIDVPTQNRNVADKTMSSSTLNSLGSPLKRTYTVEKGNVPGQVILTPDKTNISSSNHQCSKIRLITQPIQNEILKNQEENTVSRNGCSASQVVSKINLVLQEKSFHNTECRVLQSETPNNSQRNVSIVFPTQEVEIPETQNESENSVIIQSSGAMPVILIPMKQALNDTNLKGKTKQVPNIAEVNDNPYSQHEEDNIKLCDILTDDEDENCKPENIKNNSQSPLNLARSVKDLKKKILRKGSPLETQMQNSQFVYDGHSRHMVKRKCVPLNKAPGIPLNGEQFAKELASMTNYEILDLRKRNSLGKVFVISGRKSRRSQEDMKKKKSQLDIEIEREILRRNLVGITDQKNTDAANVDSGETFGERLPAPDAFRDSMGTEEQNRSTVVNTSLLDENSTDRVSFKSNKYRRSSARRCKKQLPEVLQNYLEISTKITRQKALNTLNNTKRLLYSEYQCNDTTDESFLKRRRSRSSLRKLSMPCVPSPPKSSTDLIASVQVVSPPPPLTMTSRKSTESYREIRNEDHEDISQDITAKVDDNFMFPPPPPPPGFERDESTATTSVQTREEFIETSTNLNDNSSPQIDDLLFKIPQQPAPKRILRKLKNGKTSSNVLQESIDTHQSVDKPAPKRILRKPKNGKTSSNVLQESIDKHQSVDNADSIDGTLRRSKRGRVPLSQTSCLFQILFAKTMNKYLEKETPKKNQKRKNSVRNKEISTNSVATKRSKRTKDLSPIPQTEQINNYINRNTDALSKKKKSKLGCNQMEKQNQINVSAEYSEPNRNILNPPPPVGNESNAFDQLKNPSSIISARPQTAFKVKPFKICVHRIKSATQQLQSEEENDSSKSTCTSSSVIGKKSDCELIEWLKNAKDVQNAVLPKYMDFKEYKFSAAANITFTTVQDVEYAFYDTDEKASLGYLRFKPRQVKPKKRAKHFTLHFITLVGDFRITANDKENRARVGDMVAIQKSFYYDIENLTDSIAILMVVKK